MTGGYYLGGGSGAAETLGLAPLERGSRPAARAGPPQPPGALELPPSASLAASASSTSTPAVLAPSPASPFSVPLASLVGALRHALPPAAVQDADTLGLLTGQQGLLVQQDTLVSGQAASLTCSGDDGAAGVAGGPAARSLTVPELPCSDSSKGRLLSSCTASLAALASVGTLAATNGSNGTPQGAPAPPHGVKAVCGKRTKMEDAFSVLCNFADVQMSAADTADCGYKLPARIASQVGEQLEVPTPPPAPGNPPGQPHASSPTASVPLSPNSTCVPSLSNSDQEASVGGSANSSSSSSDASDASTSTSTASTSAASACQCDTLHFFAVYDGHGGVEAAQHCANRMHYHLSVALSAVAGATVSAALHTQDTCCATNHLQAPAAADTAGGDAAAPADAPAAALVASSSAMVAASLQCEAVWTLCPSPLGDGPERSVDSIVAPPSELFPGAVPRNAGRAAGAPGARAHGADREGGDGGSQAQQALDRLFRSSEGVAQGPPAPAPAAPEAAPASRAAAAAGGAEGAAGASGADGDASSHSSGDASRSESAGTSSSSVCKSEALEEALRSAFLRTDEEFAEDGSASMVGSTAVVALVGTKKLWIANCGDSRAVLCRGGRAIQVTDDHKPEREDEAARVEKAGGQVLYWNGHRVMGVLAMSRAIGDHGLRPYVIPEPEITVLSRVADDDFLLLASDGLWDVMSNQEAITLALRCLQRSRDKGTSRKAAVRVAATVLTRAAVDRGSKDNVTVVLVDLKQPEPGDAQPVGPSSGGCAAPTAASACGAAAGLARSSSLGAEAGCDCGTQQEQQEHGDAPPGLPSQVTLVGSALEQAMAVARAMALGGAPAPRAGEEGALGTAAAAPLQPGG